ncbi:MAG: DUF1732 domain-containing protein, partial [Candidatus Omnitrophica bacterium]|nr:DUF1732 domain-containing protein [Candidatus Omnitrophota bacterium]
MITGMTGYGRRQSRINGLGKVSVELRSANHKFLETIVHLPEGMLSLEEKLKNEIESKIKRGRITCVVHFLEGLTPFLLMNKPLLKKYLSLIKCIRKEFSINDQISINTLINLPGVLSLSQAKISATVIWSRIKPVVRQALEELINMRAKEGQAIHKFLKFRAEKVNTEVAAIHKRFKRLIKMRLAIIATVEERSAFLKNSDITEELERLEFHIKNFKNKLFKSGPIGKELDFIAQEM